MNFIETGKKIYRLDNPREAHRFAVFLARCCFHPQRMDRLEEFFMQNDTLKKLADVYPFVYEQATRAFFYHKSTFDERMTLITDHMKFLTENLREDFLIDVYSGNFFELWKMTLGEELGDLHLVFYAKPGQRKEGLLSVMLQLDDETPIYQIMFWIARADSINFDEKSDGYAMWIGALQGPNVDDAKEIIKVITKKSHAYRTKNLILYAAQSVARALGLQKIFAVTNEGYYANNHIRRDRKLKTSFGAFWHECGGKLTSDERFFNLPLTETRKSVEEIPTRKRAVYRRRFELLDALDDAVQSVIGTIRNAKTS
ncbi:MAG: DUF535 domain-containing protein [Selenomonadaceae bacterium]|nr:DUF535 domain-containing protein [Selenomonadaceae bacterium]